jgi:predicted transcriptional regulator
MTTRVTTCAPEDTIHDLMNRMTQGRFRHMPVMRDGRLCGVVSIGDVVKLRIEEVEFEADSLKTFITSA